MRHEGSGGNVNHLLPGVGVYVEDRQEVVGQERVMCISSGHWNSVRPGVKKGRSDFFFKACFQAHSQ